MAAATMTSIGQLTVPKGLRDRLGLKPGDKIEFISMLVRTDDGTTC